MCITSDELTWISGVTRVRDQKIFAYIGVAAFIVAKCRMHLHDACYLLAAPLFFPSSFPKCAFTTCTPWLTLDFSASVAFVGHGVHVKIAHLITILEFIQAKEGIADKKLALSIVCVTAALTCHLPWTRGGWRCLQAGNFLKLHSTGQLLDKAAKNPSASINASQNRSPPPLGAWSL